MSRSFGDPAPPLTEKKGESHCKERRNPEPSGTVMLWKKSPPPKSWAVLSKNAGAELPKIGSKVGSVGKKPSGNEPPGENALS